MFTAAPASMVTSAVFSKGNNLCFSCFMAELPGRYIEIENRVRSCSVSCWWETGSNTSENERNRFDQSVPLDYSFSIKSGSDPVLFEFSGYSSILTVTPQAFPSFPHLPTALLCPLTGGRTTCLLPPGFCWHRALLPLKDAE